MRITTVRKVKTKTIVKSRRIITVTGFTRADKNKEKL